MMMTMVYDTDTVCRARRGNSWLSLSRDRSENNCEENVSEKLSDEERENEREDLRFAESGEEKFQVFKISFSW